MDKAGVMLGLRWLFSPWWVLVLLCSGYMGGFWALLVVLGHADSGERVDLAVLCAAMVPVVAGAMAWELHRCRQLAADVAAGEYSAITKALVGGPVPADPAARHAAARILARVAGASHRGGSAAVWVSVLAAGMALFNVYIDTTRVRLSGFGAMYAGIAVMWAVNGTRSYYTPRLAAARLAVLTEPTAAVTVTSGEVP